MPEREFLSKYNRIIKLFKDINRLLELNDRFNGIIEKLPDPSKESNFYIESEAELIEEDYKSYYWIRSKLLTKSERMFEKYNDLLEEERYQELLSSLGSIMDVMVPLSQSRNMHQIYALKPELLRVSKSWEDKLEDAKDAAAAHQRELVNRLSGVSKQDSDIDSQQAGALRKTASMRLKDNSMREISTGATVRQIIEERTEEIATKISGFKYLEQALENISDPQFMDRISQRFENTPNWLKSVLGGRILVGGLSPGDKLLGKFTLENILLRRKIRKSATFTTDIEKANRYWRKKAREKYGENVPFCDEEKDADGNWVARDSVEAQNIIINAQIELLQRISANIPDDH